MSAAPSATGNSSTLSSQTIAARIRQIVCYNQGEIIQYQFLASEYHRELKEFLRSRNLPLDDDSIDRLSYLRKKLENFLNEFMASVVLRNFSYLDLYFKDRPKEILPHYSLFMPCDDTGTEVVGLFRWPQQPQLAPKPLTRKLVKENTGFFEVVRRGEAYVSNNLPEEVYSGNYINRRICQDKVEIYRSHPTFHALDENWESVWEGYDREASTPSRCYRSTMIIPITMINNDIYSDFIERFRIKNLDRLIFGYLCFDHTSSEYFEECNDVEIGYVVADLLSLFVVYRYVFSRLSRAFKQSLALASQIEET